MEQFTSNQQKYKRSESNEGMDKHVNQLDGTVTKQQMLDRISTDIDSGATGVYKIKNGRPVIPKGFEKFTANTMVGALGFTFLGVTTLVAFNEAIGLVKIADKTPLTHIRDFINKPK